jgi:fatty-acid desaturase
MRIYNVVGYSLLIIYTVACLYFAPPHLGPWTGLLIGAAYLVWCWFAGGLYLSSVIHMGITHGALAYKEWFVKGVTVVNNVFGIYVNPVTWVNRHRLHHTFSDHVGDPNKLAADGFWRTMYLCLFPYQAVANVARDPILKSWTFRVVSNPVFAVTVQAVNFWLLWLLVRDVIFAAVIWLGTRVFALWVNMIQNFWTHDRRFGYRRHPDEHDNAMNIGDWLPVTATFSACLQNNHHHHPGFLRLSHDESEYDFGFTTVKIMKALGLVEATRKGAEVPSDVPLKSLNF